MWSAVGESIVAKRSHVSLLCTEGRGSDVEQGPAPAANSVAQVLARRCIQTDGSRSSGIRAGPDWQEAYFFRGGIEAVYDNIPRTIGMLTFAPVRSAWARCPPLGHGRGRLCATPPSGISEL